MNALPSNATRRDLIVCCDGTNNTLTGGVEDTNVLLLYGYLLKHLDPQRSVLFYDPGVGTPDAAPPTDLIDLAKRKTDRILGLASGRGVYDNIAEAYRFLMRHWRQPVDGQPEDRIFCFGFSRGAFTARCVVGMVNMFGVIRPEHEALLPTLIRIYFSQPPEDEQIHGRSSVQRSVARWLHTLTARPDKAGTETAQPSEETTEVGTRPLLALQVRRDFGIDDPNRQATVHWVGVWDTVESVGFPILFSRDNPSTAYFHDKPGIRNVRHALSFDEHRLAFQPRLYDEPHELQKTDARGQRTFKQYWFPGVHCDVGGSYSIESSGLADRAWLWMFNEVAPELGLSTLQKLPLTGSGPFDEFGMTRRQPFPSDQLLRHDALWDTPLWAVAGMTVRNMQKRRVATNEEVRQAKKAKRPLDSVGVLVDVCAHDATGLQRGPSVWDTPRKPWPLAAMIFVAWAALALSGWCLGGPDSWTIRPACHFAMEQLTSAVPVERLPQAVGHWVNACGDVPSAGLRDPLSWSAYLKQSPAWAMFWDLVAIVGIGYLLGRISSRSFTFLAGFSRPDQARRIWLCAIGVLPLLAVLSDVAEDVLTMLAIALERLQIPLLVPYLLIATGICSFVKLASYYASVGIFGSIRLFLAVWPTTRVGKVGRGASPVPRRKDSAGLPSDTAPKGVKELPL